MFHLYAISMMIFILVVGRTFKEAHVSSLTIFNLEADCQNVDFLNVEITYHISLFVQWSCARDLMNYESRARFCITIKWCVFRLAGNYKKTSKAECQSKNHKNRHKLHD